jgi:hypothetical protein
MTSLPPSLVRFEAQLAHAIESDHRPRRARPIGGRAVRLSLATAIAAGVALGALSLVPGSGPSAVARAAAALQPTGGTILHLDAAVQEVGADGSSSTFREESWQEAYAPFAHRSVRTQNGVRIDIVTRADGSSELYDATTNTVYSVTSGEGATGTQSQPASSPPPGATLEPPATSEMSPANGTPSSNPTSDPGSQNAGNDPTVAQLSSITNQVLGILASGDVSEAGHVTVDGRDALKLASADGKVTILVDPQTCEPILWTIAAGPNGSELSAHFDVYDPVPETLASATLFDLHAQHPNASVDTSPADYAAALTRLSATG